MPNLTAACYTGPPATRNVGSCEDGSWTCNGQGTDLCQVTSSP
jgi:hypothetical protein